MKMFLVGCVVLFILVLITALFKAKSPGHQATRKHIKKKKSQALGADPFSDSNLSFEEEESLTFEDLDEDAVLGLKKTEGKSEHPIEEKSMAAEPSKLQYVVLHIMATPNKEFAGYELLQALLSNGLRYGKQRIFHYHENKHGQGPVLFSLASVNQPGTFDLPKMSHFSCPGLTMFMVLKELARPTEALEKMLTSAKQLAEDLGGEVYSENHQSLTVQEIKTLREQVANYVENTQTIDMFD